MNTTPFNISALAREHGVSRKTIRRRLAAGWRPGAPTLAPTLGMPIGTPETAVAPDASSSGVPTPASHTPPPMGAAAGRDAPTPMGDGTTRVEVLPPIARSRPAPLVSVVFLLGLVTAGVGLWLNASFLWAFGRTSEAGVTLAVIGGITDGATLVLPPTLVGLWARRRFVLTGTAFAVYLVAVTMTALNTLGFASTNIGDAVAGRSARTEQRAALVDDIARRKAERAGLAAFTPTSAEAVTAATVARDQECGRVGENCRRRVAELNAALRDRDLAVRAAELDAAIARLTGELARTPALASADPQVESAAAVIAWASRGALKPAAGDIEMVRLLGVAFMPILGGMLFGFAMGLAQPPRFLRSMRRPGARVGPHSAGRDRGGP